MISLCMIVKNEEALLGRCLASVKGLVDEIIVVDTGSTDWTVEIARNMGARVEFFEWCDDFAAARNYSLEFATQDWILFLDADEALNPEEHSLIRSAIESGKTNGYALVLRNYFTSGNSTTFDQAALKNNTGFHEEFPYYCDSIALRLFRRGPKFKNRIHELPDVPEYATIPPVIHHLGKMGGERESAKRGYYLRLAKEEAEARPMNCQLWFSLAGEAYVIEDYETALHAAKNYIRLQPERVPLMMIQVAGSSSLALGDVSRAMFYFGKLLDMDPNHVPALMMMSRALFQSGQLDKAFKMIRKAIQVNPAFTGSYLTMATMKERIKDSAGAFCVILDGLSLNPQDPMLLERLDNYTPRA